MGYDKPSIWVAGDPILDVYLEGKHFPTPDGTKFHVDKRFEEPGAALNTYMNLRVMSESMHFRVYKMWDYSSSQTKKFYRLNGTNEQTLFMDVEQSNKETIYSPPESVGRFGLYHPSDTLVVSDYNKGAVTSHPQMPVTRKEWKLGVFDSKYRTVHPSFIEACKVSVWHATSYEYNKEYAQRFDFVAWTRGPDELTLIDVDTDEALTQFPKSTTVVCDTGAGDTYTAALAAWLTVNAEDIDIYTLAAASDFALACCADVVSQPRTAAVRQGFP